MPSCVSIYTHIYSIYIYIYIFFFFRVLAPPGGKTSINLFGGDQDANTAPKAVNPCQAARQQSHVFDTADKPMKVNQHQAQRQESHIFGQDQPSGNAVPVHTSSKVIKAPGGGSSIKLG